MSEMKMAPDVEIEEFTEELSDEALDRAGARLCGCCVSNCCRGGEPER